ncbi:type I glyceraldehyde-3-phosphate dehydrogenase [Candidatus Poribacteria bacterium]|jgi:glyceraldehyde 3-phosphate dehydrogenase|nr:type I glyceraldehyde-3-phosphate dehydrogenase [Candidatus Poribacteria bacterium]MCP4731318.1 ArsJ-associated glyceraldehyde-3-phosphate dehydrogenase [Roseibacillus sp.]MDP6206943.1 ArsJ-associated glyceraldehyde-3-phosphate dehydrogenase [Roseibacillus sp.]MDP7306571.1 ArsJ-associated glyceraldehyde-3-phosphate dehydrogenase [Roseibacillus sp.]MDP7497368.1 ArsJ-associated glyceraldehyde-3-phosphate dehydrogenase [Roseibacillus sp.]|tara:strand:- start:1546 stop:2553 length:1008 start_codon:yes stop_codon:yes gene_type:complete
MSIRVGINGFGRMGRLGFRAGWDDEDIEIVHVNELKGGCKLAAHLLEYDTVHGRWDRGIAAEEDRFVVEGKEISFSGKPTPGEVDWAGMGIDLVVESSGAFRSREVLQPYFDGGVRKVVVAAPVEEALNIVMGCNDRLYDPARHDLVTAASCTTNCLAPVVKVIQEKIGIVHGLITTLHDVTNTQVMVDAPHKDFRRARSALNSLIPTTTGSATAITMIYPELEGKLNGLAVRLPLLNASLTDCVFELARETSVQEVNGFLREASEGELKGILGFEEKPLVSADFVNDVRSGIVDGPATMVNDGTQLKVLVWYDNEFGYACRLMELVARVARSLS